MERVFIYGLIDPITNELRYIGKSINPKARLRKHISERYNHDSYKDRWIRKLIDCENRPELIIIDEVLKDEWVFWEKHYISYFKMIGVRLTNTTLGGDQPPSTKGRKHTEDSKIKMSESKKGKPIPWLNNGKERNEKHKSNLSKSLKGRVSPNKGKTYKEIYGEERANELIKFKKELEYRKGEEHPFYNKKRSKKTKNKISEKLSIAIVQLDLGGKLIKEWESIKIAQETLKIGNISSVCNNKRKTSGGFIWKYKI